MSLTFGLVCGVIGFCMGVVSITFWALVMSVEEDQPGGEG